MAKYRFAFSYSRWALWKQCPAAYKYKNIDKLPEPASPAMERGRKVHDDVANYVDNKRDDRPKVLDRFTMLADGIRRVAPENKLVEGQLAFDRDFKRCDWFGPNAYTRFIWDAAIWDDQRREMNAVDWKTGQPRGSYDDQMQIFAMPAYWTLPNLESFTGHLVYLDHGDSVAYPIDRATWFGAQGDPARKDGYYGMWLDNIARFEADTTFAPTPSFDACKFCKFKTAKGGPCQVSAC